MLTQLAEGIPVTIAGSSGATDYELVVSTYTCRVAFTGASVGDIITQTQVIAITNGVASTFLTVWRNQSTAADLASAPASANISLNGATALTDAQLRASAVPVSLATVPSHPVTNAGTFAVQNTAATPAGSNSIGTVGLNAGTNAIGSITNTSFGVSTLPALPTGSNTIGSINAVASITNALPTGTNVIGGVTLTRASTATRSDFTAAVDTQIVAASTSRPMLSIYNVGPAILRIGLGSTVTSLTNFTYLLNAGDTYVANPNEVTLEHRAIFAAAGSVAEVTIGA